jgi:hypothetical protein
MTSICETMDNMHSANDPYIKELSVIYIYISCELHSSPALVQRDPRSGPSDERMIIDYAFGTRP